MLTTALDLVTVLEAIEVVKTSKLLTEEQRKVILGEIVPAIPAPVFCKQCPQTLSIIKQLVETTDGRTKEPTKEDREAAKVSEAGNPTGEQPTSKTASNARGAGKAPSNASKPQKQRRSPVKRT